MLRKQFCFAALTLLGVLGASLYAAGKPPSLFPTAEQIKQLSTVKDWGGLQSSGRSALRLQSHPVADFSLALHYGRPEWSRKLRIHLGQTYVETAWLSMISCFALRFHTINDLVQKQKAFSKLGLTRQSELAPYRQRMNSTSIFPILSWVHICSGKKLNGQVMTSTDL